MDASEVVSLLPDSTVWDSQSYLLYYPETLSQSAVISALTEQFSRASIIADRDATVEELHPVGPGPHILPLLDVYQTGSLSSSEDHSLKSLCETSNTVLIAPGWFEICLSYPFRPRWVTRVEVLRTASSDSVEETIRRFPSERPLKEGRERRVLYYYMTERRFKHAVDSMPTVRSDKIRAEISRLKLSELSSEVKKLLAEPEAILYSSLAATKLQQQGHLNLAEFRVMYADGTPLNTTVEDTPFLDALLRPLDDTLTTPPFELTDIRVLTSILFAPEETEAFLAQRIDELVATPPSEWSSPLNGPVTERFIDRIELFTVVSSEPSVRDFYRALPLLGILRRLPATSDTEIVLDAIRLYDDIETRAIRQVVSKALVDVYQRQDHRRHTNVERIGEFLEDPGPKIVLVIDSLSLMEETTRKLVLEFQGDSIGYAFAPPHSDSEAFENALAYRIDLDTLGGFTTKDGLDQTSLTDVVQQDAQREQLESRLNAAESFIISDAKLDVQARYQQSRGVEVNNYVRTIRKFITLFGDVADILITADHGMVDVDPATAITASLRSAVSDGPHNRGMVTESTHTDVDGTDTVELDSGRTLVTPLDPNSRLGSHDDRLWTHGGISIEESLVPSVILRN